RVVKDDANRVTLSSAKPTHTVPKIHAIGSSRSGNRPLIDRKSYSISLTKRHDFRPRLHSRSLLCQHKLASGKISFRFREQKGNLDREDVLAIQVLMQAVVVAGSILQQERSRS